MTLLAVIGCGPADVASDSRSELTLQSKDGTNISATLTIAAGTPSPGLILVHMYGSDRTAWESFAVQAQREGYSVISIDMRGHADTATLNPNAKKYRSFSATDWKDVLLDIDAAKSMLIENGVDEDRIGVMGASIGANLAAAYAAHHQDIQALVMLSPGKDYKGVRVEPAFAQYGKRPSLLVTGEGDRYSADTCRSLHREAKGFCEFREFPGIYHGTNILDAIPNASGQILQWCNTVLRESSPAQP